MDQRLLLYLVVCPLLFLGGFVDSVAGGGGLITLPAYFLAGIPVHIAAGTNKLVNCLGSSTAAIQYLRSGKIRLPIALTAAAGALAGSTLGAQLALLLPERLLKGLMLIALPLVAVLLALKKDIGGEGTDLTARSPRRTAAISLAIGLVIGVYDGLIGPGTGTFLIMAFSAFLSLNLITASGCAKVVNASSNIAAAVIYLLHGKVLWSFLLPAAACCILGNFCGARCAIRGGSRRIRSMIFVVLILLFIKLGCDLVL
ncbi:MAG: TSUP family transporter [Oscillospiraceae bacterium]|nr:TSUP family transporter [Oscillospiraceae bacterium]MCI9588534.1 TSUP family transporter [Oscillospiraceae bacterium]